MRRILAILLFLLLLPMAVAAGSIDDIRQALLRSAQSQVQEKVYIHTDNSCYFIGDTLWYKAYVVRADRLVPTDMSRILYVELLTPDGLLVERQNIIVSPQGHTCGQFVLRDSLYSGYYELRAYTRWMLNFNVSHRRFSQHDTWNFYNRQMAADYFRQWDGLYSRVLPVYSKPEQPGDYDVRRMYQRPKQRIPQTKKDNLSVTFYPEGGHLIEGVENRVAFEVTDQHGEAQDISGTIEATGMSPLTIKTDYMGRGTFLVTPGRQRLSAHFTFRGRHYDCPLPQAEPQGMALHWADGRLTVTSRQLPQGGTYGLSVLCRGALHYFSPLPGLAERAMLSVPLDSLPTGVNELTVFDADGRIWASRLFFVNHHDHDEALVVADTSTAPAQTYQPYQQISLPVKVSGATAPVVFSLSICDTNTDEPTYNDGNLMTDLLLSSDLRGFIAHPAHYFENDDAVHRRHLDLLMLVQGWRRYSWQELTDTTRQLRYQPEKTMTVEGGVYKMTDLDDTDADDVASWQNGQGMTGHKPVAQEVAEDPNPWADETESSDLVSTADIGADLNGSSSDMPDAAAADAADHVVRDGMVRREVLVEAELMLGKEVVGAVQKTHRGRFVFEIPPFYGATYLNLKAYNERDSLSKSFASRKDADMFNEKAYPDYFVKRDMPYPVLTNRYSFYQNHAPEWQVTIDEDSLSEFSMENDVHQLQNVNVKGRRRGRRAIDWTKPAYVCDAYELYNNLTDYGLSFGHYFRGLFPAQAAHFLYGNMERYNSFNIDGRLEGYTYWRNYSDIIPGVSVNLQRSSKRLDNRSTEAIFNALSLGRLQSVRIFSDYEPRNPDSTLVEERYRADAVVEMVPIPDHGKQVSFRDRHIYLRGFNEPARFYQPSYGNRPLGNAPADYRRTLYWNPNAVTDDEGRFTATFYNNGKETRIKMTAAGITPDGKLLHCRQPGSH